MPDGNQLGAGDSIPASKQFSTPSHPITSTPDTKDFGFGMNLSRISERTEFTDWSKSEYDKTNNTSSYRPEILSSLSEKQKSVEYDPPVSKGISARSETENSPTKLRSVLSIIFGCLFPFCRFP